MAPMKRAASGAAPIKSRCNIVQRAVQQSDVPDRVKEMLCRTISLTVGTPTADRHPFNARFVTMIEKVLAGEMTRLNQDLADKNASFAELGPSKGIREAAVEQAKATAAEKAEALRAADGAVSEVGATVKAASAEVKNMRKAQKAGDEELEGATVKKTMLERTLADSLTPLCGTEDPEMKDVMMKEVLSTAKSFAFDASLMSTAAQVLERAPAERGAFDATCLEQLKEAFSGAIAKFDEQLAAGAPGKAERAAAVEQAEAAEQTAKANQADLKEKAAAAREAKAAADGEAKAAAKNLADFMPDLKAAGDALDEAKNTLQSFVDGAQVAFAELKEHKEGDYQPKKTYYEKINGVQCDRAVIDACRQAVAGAGDGRVSTEDAKNVFAAIADGGKETRTERWTLRYCLQEFKWTEAAHDWIVQELKKVPQEEAESPSKKARTEGEAYYEIVDGVKCDRAIVDACREAMGGQGDGRVSVEDAQKVWEKAADGNKVTNKEKWTLTYCLSAFHWTRAAHDFILEEMAKH